MPTTAPAAVNASQVAVDGEAASPGALREEDALINGGVERELGGHWSDEHLAGVRRVVRAPGRGWGPVDGLHIKNGIDRVLHGSQARAGAEHTLLARRRLAQRLGLSHAQAVTRVRSARRAGLLPRVLDAEGLRTSLEILCRTPATTHDRPIEATALRLRFGNTPDGTPVTLGLDDLSYHVGLLGPKSEMEPLALALVTQLIDAGWTGAVLTDPASPLALLDLVPATSLTGSPVVSCWGIHLGDAIASAIDFDDAHWYLCSSDVASLSAWALGRPDEEPYWGLGELAALLSEENLATGYQPARPGSSPLGVQPRRNYTVTDDEVRAAHAVGAHLTAVLEAAPELASRGPRGVDLRRPVLVSHRDLRSGPAALLASLTCFGVLQSAPRPAFLVLDAGVSEHLVHEVLARARAAGVIVLVLGRLRPSDLENLGVRFGHDTARPNGYLYSAHSGLSTEVVLAGAGVTIPLDLENPAGDSDPPGSFGVC